MRKLYALCTKQGTAASETCLCDECINNLRHRTSVIQNAPDDVDLLNWHNVTDNEYVACQICGHQK